MYTIIQILLQYLRTNGRRGEERGHRSIGKLFAQLPIVVVLLIVLATISGTKLYDSIVSILRIIRHQREGVCCSSIDVIGGGAPILTLAETITRAIGMRLKVRKTMRCHEWSVCVVSVLSVHSNLEVITQAGERNSSSTI